MRAIRFFFFYPLSFIIKKIYQLRRFLYRVGYLKSRNLDIPVISIGNLAMGGTGKTPHTILISQLLDAHGFKNMILSRGYKGNLSHIGAEVLDTTKTSAYGDEPCLLKEKLETTRVVIGADRFASYEKFKQDELVAIMDDGFQHLKLQRTFNIVLIDSNDSWYDSSVFPSGKYREDLSALEDADLIILTKAEINLNINRSMARIKKYFPYKKMMVSRIAFDEIVPLNLNKTQEIKKDIILICGIGDAKSFEDQLLAKKFNIIKRYILKNHKDYTPSEINRFLKESKELDASILMTEKDAIKWPTDQILDFSVFIFKIKIDLDESNLMEILLPQIKGMRC